jgi:DNA-directed RNA polymerase specialized sigma24 family protein
MFSANSYTGIDDRVVASVRHHARRASTRLAGMELEDVEQELMIHAHRRMPSFDPRRADIWTYSDRVLSNFVRNLLRSAGAVRRGGGLPTIALDDPELVPNGEPAADAVHDHDPTEVAWCEQAHLRHDLDRVLHALPQHLQDCCRWLTTSTVTEAARCSALARGSLYSRIATLKRAFIAAGLEAYLASPTRHF